ncbi:tetratricopeptide repeat protein [Flagellimonas sp. S3867]|uniref:tetratricopeptide repeat protein n=1 Tax=Flagellimonas sp. S3867 TaxID=2768063 RepID=UPI001687F776|nr:tetratricopeptide repeat protein [Flagellimonas sp. S3867]
MTAQSKSQDSLLTVWQDISKQDSTRLEAAYSIFISRFRQNLDSARVFGNEMLEFSQETNNLQWQATSTRLVGNTYAVQGKLEDALNWFNRSLVLSKKLESQKDIAVTLSNIGTIHYEIGNYTQSISFLLEGLKISEELDDKPGLSRVTNNLGNVFIEQKNNEKALEYYLYSLKLKEELNNPRTLPAAYNNIALVYGNQKKYDQAFQYLIKSIEIAEEVNDKIGLSRAYANMGSLYNEQGDYKTALEFLNKSIRIKREIQDNEGLPTTYLYRGKTYLNQKKFQLAKRDCTKSLAMSEKMGALLAQEEACECLSLAWEGLGNANKSLEFYRRFTVLKDSLFNKNKTEEITRNELQYQFEKEQLADSIAFHSQQAAQQVAFERDLNTQRNKFYIFLFGGLGLLLFGVFYWRSRQKTQELKKEREVVQRLKQVDQLKDQFLANTSHELRTPLVGIIGLTESLKEGIAGKLSKAALENLDMIANSGKRLSHLVNDILDFSKLKNKDIELSLREVDVHALSTIVLRLSHPLIQDKKLKLINSIPKDVPLVNADENRLQQIMHNLIGNAIKFTQKGYVTLFSETKDDMLSISITDTGIGIPEDKLDTIFNSFEQADGSTQREYGGTGLGLSVTKQLVELHGGSIDVSTEEGKGSIFTFTLPLSSTDRKDFESNGTTSTDFVQMRSTLQKELPLPGSKKIKGQEVPRILIVDDEPVNRRVLENHLTVAGYEITEVSSGKEALEELENENLYNLVLLDVMMPGISGYEVCEKIRERYIASDLPVILLTAKNTVNELVVGFNAGANDYLTKPISKNELLSRIKTHINLNTIHRATSRFVPSEFVQSVGKQSITDVRLGDHIEKNVTVLFSDIRDYTTLAESMTPEQNFKFVNAYVGRMGPIIKENEGFVNQYLGDGIMALFPHKSESALDAAIEMQRTLSLYNKRRVKEKGYAPISVGMGLHTGQLIMGIIGDTQRNDPAVISDTVNSASRVEGVTKHFGANIIISEDTLNSMTDISGFNFRYLGKVRVKGKQKAIGIYECIDGDKVESITLKLETKKNYDAGVKLFFDQNFVDSLELFEKILVKNPKDTVTQYFVSACEKYISEGAPKNWQSMTVMHEK